MAHSTRSGGRVVRPGRPRPEQPDPKSHHCPTHPTAGEADHEVPRRRQRRKNLRSIVVATPKQLQAQTGRALASHRKTHPSGNKLCGEQLTTNQRSRQGTCGPLRNRRQADQMRLRQLQTNTTRRARPGRSTTNTTSDRRAATLPRQQRLDATGFAPAGIRTGNPTQNTSSTRCVRTTSSQTRQDKHRPTKAQPNNTETAEATIRTTSGGASAGRSAKKPTAKKLTIRQLAQPCTIATAAEKQADHQQTTPKPANTQQARHAGVETGTT